MFMKRLSTIATAVVVAGCQWGPSPTDAVEALIEAIGARDSVAIARYANIARVAESSVDPLIEAAGMMSTSDDCVRRVPRSAFSPSTKMLM